MDKLWFLSLGLFLLAWMMNSCIPPKRPPLVNYDSTIFFNSDVDQNPNGPLYLLPTEDHAYGMYANTNLLLPRSKDEIAWIVKSVAATWNHKDREGGGSGRGRRIRVIGSGHSWSKLAKSDDIQLSLENYKGLVSVDKEKMEATVRAGTTLEELNSLLEEHGLAVRILGSISEQTVGGAIATGTHGSGIGFGNLASMVSKLELITGEGKIMTLSPQENRDVFKAAQVSVGLLGVVTEVTLQIEPAFNLHETRHTIPLHECLDNMEAIVNGGQHVKYWIDLYTEKCAVHVANRTIEPRRGLRNRFVETVKNHLLEITIAIYSWFPSAVPWLMNFIFNILPDALPSYDTIDKSYHVFNIPHYFPVHHESELVLDFKDCAAAIREQRKFVLSQEIPLNYVTEVRFVKSDDIWLSADYQRDSCHITLCIHNPTKEMRELYFFGLYRALGHLKPRLHWGKEFNLTLNEVQIMYPKLDQFLAIRRVTDPHGIFVNELLANTLKL